MHISERLHFLAQSLMTGTMTNGDRQTFHDIVAGQVRDDIWEVHREKLMSRYPYLMSVKAEDVATPRLFQTPLAILGAVEMTTILTNPDIRTAVRQMYAMEAFSREWKSAKLV